MVLGGKELDREVDVLEEGPSIGVGFVSHQERSSRDRIKCRIDNAVTALSTPPERAMPILKGAKIILLDLVNIEHVEIF